MNSTIDPTAPANAPMLAESPLKRFIALYCESRVASIALAVLACIVIVATFAPWVSPQDPYDLAAIDIMDARLAPGETSATGMTFLLGSDDQGRDLISAIIHGLRTSLGVGIVATIAAVAIGLGLGLVAAYAGGRTEFAIMRIVDLQLSFPAILIALVLLALLGQGVDKIIIALVTVQWAYYARTVRSTALVERNKDYVEAARCLRLSSARILFRHILPNCLPPLIVVATVQVAHAIALEATLSFLGLGLPITEPSLGLLIANGFAYLLSGKYWISFYPGVALLITIMSINLVADQLRDVLNPRLAR
jgi:peptide/nickel transport system permease protein